MRLYIGNLASNTTEQMLRNAFATHGTVNDCRIPTDRSTGALKGFGVVEMAQDDQANKAIAALNATDLDGQTIEVRESHPKANGANGKPDQPKTNGAAKTKPTVAKAAGNPPAQPEPAKAPANPAAAPATDKTKTPDAKVKN